MNTLQINYSLKQLKCFKGTFPRDMLPTISTRPCAIIVNTDKSSKPGQHWVSMYFNQDHTAEYFDPYGLPPLFKEFQEFLQVNAPNGFLFNKITLQALNSNVCGNYCVLYAKLRCKGYTLSNMLNLFSNNRPMNDELVKLISP